MSLNKKHLVKIGGGIILGGLAGIGISMASGWLGSSCTIMCNPKIAGGLGMLIGGLFAVGE